MSGQDVRESLNGFNTHKLYLQFAGKPVIGLAAFLYAVSFY